ncbi:MAG: hypothetical protein DLM67_25770 [Candidatus Nephthysia bennettiae]|uniref:single-stranded DNA-binding protein n=1 Tax=Candidatus Nephthysia bennettiae TaxID=3127016 RepID=UPI000DB8107F|nr:MAG: hypothetical protein DLM67_25770 [Candidatus Dormibacteraeota bacterium]
MKRGRVQLLGWVTNGPEFYLTPSGEAVSRFELGTTVYGPSSAEGPIDRHRCLAWNGGGRRLADLVLDNVKQGDVVYVEGRLQAVPPVVLEDSGEACQVIVRDLQLLESVQRSARLGFEAAKVRQVDAE